MQGKSAFGKGGLKNLTKSGRFVLLTPACPAPKMSWVLLHESAELIGNREEIALPGAAPKVQVWQQTKLSGKRTLSLASLES
jgi:hypothetical protein